MSPPDIHTFTVFTTGKWMTQFQPDFDVARSSGGRRRDSVGAPSPACLEALRDGPERAE